MIFRLIPDWFPIDFRLLMITDGRIIAVYLGDELMCDCILEMRISCSKTMDFMLKTMIFTRKTGVWECRIRITQRCRTSSRRGCLKWPSVFGVFYWKCGKIGELPLKHDDFLLKKRPFQSRRGCLRPVRARLFILMSAGAHTSTLSSTLISNDLACRIENFLLSSLSSQWFSNEVPSRGVFSD